jgi:hypothetical protein
MSTKPENQTPETLKRMETFPKPNTIPSGWNMSELMAVYNQTPPPVAPPMGKKNPVMDKPSTTS